MNYAKYIGFDLNYRNDRLKSYYGPRARWARNYSRRVEGSLAWQSDRLIII